MCIREYKEKQREEKAGNQFCDDTHSFIIDCVNLNRAGLQAAGSAKLQVRFSSTERPHLKPRRQRVMFFYIYLYITYVPV